MIASTAPEVGEPRPSPLYAWLLAIRPKTLTAGLVPVLVGTGLAYGQGRGRPGPALAALLGALLIQVGTNLTNDYYDFKNGADTAERVGPKRATQSGWMPPASVLRGAMVAFGLAVLAGLYLTAVAGWPIVVIGVASLLSGYAYTGGPYPLGYHGLGDLFVMVFFGLVAVGGTYFVQAGAVTPEALAAGVPVGALGTALLVVNNLRDAATDATAGKRTLVVRLGVSAGRLEYCLLLLLGFLAPIALFAHGERAWVLLPLLSLPLVGPPLKRVLKSSGGALNPALPETARLQLVYGVLFAIGLWGAGH